MSIQKPKVIISPSCRPSSSCDSYETYESESTAPTSIYGSTHASVKDAMPLYKFKPVYEEDISPSASCCPSASVDTFDSTLASEEDLSRDVDTDSYEADHDIPPLPIYRHQIEDPNVRPSTPQEFARLFPSMDRLSIRHDDFTPDGNLNLRVDAVNLGHCRKTAQLFHLRMHDLSKRDFSLRRYCRESGREVCKSKRKYTDPTHEDRPNLQRSMSSAIKTLTRTNSAGSTTSGTRQKDLDHKRPLTSGAAETSDAAGDFAAFSSRCPSFDNRQKQRPRPTNTIKLEFSNYARVDVVRRGSRKTSKHYDFEWWGHTYHWKRVEDKNIGSVSFHLFRGSRPVAHIVPETRSPNQVEVDEEAGGWVPPCHMWISDRDTIEAATDVADVVVATGLVALVDDCIKERWQHGRHESTSPRKIHRIPVPLTHRTFDVEYLGPRAFMQHLFQRRASDPHQSSSVRHRHRNVVSAY